MLTVSAPVGDLWLINTLEPLRCFFACGFLPCPDAANQARAEISLELRQIAVSLLPFRAAKSHGFKCHVAGPRHEARKLQEIIEFLKGSAKVSKAGRAHPKGVLSGRASYGKLAGRGPLLRSQLPFLDSGSGLRGNVFSGARRRARSLIGSTRENPPLRSSSSTKLTRSGLHRSAPVWAAPRRREQTL